jgi:hypothetical protein
LTHFDNLLFELVHGMVDGIASPLDRTHDWIVISITARCDANHKGNRGAKVMGPLSAGFCCCARNVCVKLQWPLPVYGQKTLGNECPYSGRRKYAGLRQEPECRRDDGSGKTSGTATIAYALSAPTTIRTGISLGLGRGGLRSGSAKRALTQATSTNCIGPGGPIRH